MAASEERSISEFPSAVAILATTLLFVSTVNGNTYDSEKTTAAELATAILGDFEYTTDLDTSIKTIFGAINSIMVLSGTTVPSSASGANGQLYVKYTSSGGTDTVDGLYWKINNAWVEISTGGGGGASVTLGTTVPSDASGSDGDLYVQYDGTSYAVIDYYVKINGSWRKSPYSRVVALTQAEYDLITPDNQTLYVITDAQSSYQTKTDNSLATTDKTVVGAINELKANIDYNSYNAVNWGTYRGSLSITGGQWNTISNGTVRDVNSFTSKTDNKITLPDDSLYMVFANVSTNDGSGLVGLIATDNNTELATFLYNKISGQSNKYMGYWVVAGAQNKEISLKVFAQGTGVTATIEIDVIRISLSRDS